MSLGHAELSLVAQQARLTTVATRATLRTRSLAALQQAAVLLPFPFTGSLYELLRGPFSHRGAVHVEDLLALETRFFSIATSQGPRPLSEVIASHTSSWLDLWCGATYLLFLIEILGVSLYLSFRSRSLALELSLGFLAANLLGWLVWHYYPSAPPWYVDDYGLHSSARDVLSSPAGLARFDALLGVPLAANFYAKSANVFGAVPSLHVAYSTLVACVLAPRRGWLRYGALGFALSMAFSAVYLRHHYLLDVLAGLALALLIAAASRAIRWIWSRSSAAFVPPGVGLRGGGA